MEVAITKMPQPVLQKTNSRQIEVQLGRSTETFLEYRKAAHENLININNSLSLMLQEASSGIDNLCHKVRLCLLEADAGSRIINQYPVQDIHKDAVNTNDCHCVDSDVSVIEEATTEENHNEKNDKDTESTQIEESKKTESNTDAKESKNIQPFFTILKPKMQPTDASGMGTKSSEMHLSENFKRTMKEIEEFPNYDEFLDNMVGILSSQISNCYPDIPSKNKLKKSTKISIRKSQTERKQNCLEDRFSDNDIHSSRNSLIKDKRSWLDKLGCLQAIDIYRKRAVTDLHRRMIAQLEANDSLTFFQRLMARSKKHRPSTYTPDEPQPAKEQTLRSPAEVLMNTSPSDINRRRMRSLADLSKKYENSLWFRQKKVTKTKKDKSKKSKKAKTTEQCVPQTCSVPSCASLRRRSSRSIRKKKESQCNCLVTVTNDQPLSEPNRCRLHWMRTKYSQMSNRKLKHLDILDEITKSDLLPIKAEYPRRDNIQSNVKDTYLYKLMYGKGKDTQEAWSHLFQPNTACSQRDCDKCSRQIILEEKEDEIANIDEPKQTNDKPSSKGCDRGDALPKLAKYIFPDDEVTKIQKVFTVMPVHVVYDNFRLSSNNKRPDCRPKLPLTPMKEYKEPLKRAEWSETGKRSKPMKVVYDATTKRVEKEVKMSSARPEATPAMQQKFPQTSSWSPKNFSQYSLQKPVGSNLKNTPVKTEIPMAQAQQKIQKAPPLPQQKLTEVFKAPVKVRMPNSDRPMKGSKKSTTNSLNVSHLNYLNLDNSTAKNGYETRQPDTRTKQKIEEMLLRDCQGKTDSQKKIWDNKYGKTVGQKLVSFIEHQPPNYEIPMPKYAMPKMLKQADQQKQMLEQLKNLQKKNHSIQSNIQRAIEVIENKMIDILSKPTSVVSIDAFDQMEKEISNVLSSMKITKSKDKVITDKKDTLSVTSVEDYEVGINISDQLLKRLEKILESAGNTTSTASIPKKHNKNEEKPRRKLKVNITKKSSAKKKTTIFSSTSTSMDEKFTPKQDFANEDLVQNVEPIYGEELVSVQEFEEIGKLPNIQIVPPKEIIVGVALVEEQMPIIEPVVTVEGQENIVENGINNNMPLATCQGDEQTKAEGTENISAEIEPTPPTDITEELSPNSLTKPDQTINDAPLEAHPSEMLSATTEGSLYFSPLMSPQVKNRCEVDKETKIPEEGSKQDEVAQCDLYDQVNRIISRVENVYSQLEKFEDEVMYDDNEDLAAVRIFKEDKHDEVKSEIYLTPFMHALKDLRKNADSPKLSPKMHKSPSYYNVISFLDSLADFREDAPIEVNTARICSSSVLTHIPTTIYYSYIQHEINYIPAPREASLQNVTSETATQPLKLQLVKSGCLKKSPRNSKSEIADNVRQSKARVTFRIKKEEKSTQVTPCPLHKCKNFKSNSSAEIQPSRTDEEISARLDAAETTNRSVDVMSSSSYDVSESGHPAAASDSSNSDLLTADSDIQSTCQINEETSRETGKSDLAKGSEVAGRRGEEKYTAGGDLNVSKKGMEDDQVKQRMITGSYGEATIEKLKRTLSKDLTVAKELSLEKLQNNKEGFFAEISQNSPLIGPLKHLSEFIDPGLLKEAIDKRQALRMFRRSTGIGRRAPPGGERLETSGGESKEKESIILKSFYVFVYMVMFTALNLEYKCM